ncbi:MAG: aryl-sulfate sulfotransferase [Ignavibacteriae bacterium]|nr:aryl-sulfate sulfotransferase [Ignavibacteriota bacterium]
MSELYSQPEYQFTVEKLDKPYPGYIRFDWVLNPNFAVVDNYGYYQGYKQTREGGPYFFELRNGNFAQLSNDVYYIYDKNMNRIDSIPNKTGFATDFHDFISLSNGRYLMLVNELHQIDMSQIVEGGREDAYVIDNILIETDRTGTVYWEWHALDHMEITDATPDIDLTMVGIDFAHINSMFEDANGNILISIRHFDEIALINKSTGEFAWRIGGSYSKNNQYSFTNDFNADFKGFSHQHTAQILPNGNILMFDNGNMRENPFSRAVEYSVNHSSKTITKVWEFINNPPTYNASMGSVQRLPNGNTLIAWSRGTINEVRPDGSVAFELNLAYNFPFYRAQKVSYSSVYDEKQISGAGNYNFTGANGNTGVSISVANIGQMTRTYLQKHDYAPPYFEPSNQNLISTLPLRWVLSTDKNEPNLNGTFKVRLADLNYNDSPSKLVIYKRSKEGYGVFEMLQTYYSQATGELYADFSGWGEFVIDVIDLDKPILLSPSYNSFISNEGNLVWSSVTGAEYYQVQLSKTQNFSNTLFSQIVNNDTKYNFSNLSFNDKYFWRVRAIATKDTSEWSDVFTFNTNVAAPELTFPDDFSFGFSPKDTIKWSKVDGADSYQIQINYYENFTNPIINAKNINNNYFTFLGFTHNIKYYWRVRAFKGSDSSSWSDVREFTTVIATPILSSPADSVINVPNKFNFSWSYVQGTDFYEFQLADNVEFDNLIMSADKLKNESIEISELQYDKSYFWRVKASRSTDESDWSDTRMFTTMLSPVQLKYPDNNANNTNVDIRLSWDKKAAGIKFKLQISNDYNFENIFIELDNLEYNYYQIEELAPNKTYVWRVMAYRDELISPWSNSFSFKTGKGLELMPPSLILPHDGAEAFSEVSLHWNQRIKAINYTLQVSTNNLFANNVIEHKNIKETHLILEDLKINDTYYWRVKAYSKYDSSGWSQVRSFNIIEPGRIVELVKPGNDALQVPLAGKLEWNEIADIDYYTLQVSKNSNFDENIIFEDVYKNSFFNYINFDYHTTYFWRVRYSRDGELSEWSATWPFTTASKTSLSIPVITNLKDGVTTVPVAGKISWNPVSYASDYQVSISNHESFRTIMYKQSGIIGNELNYSNLEYGTLYYVRIAASNDSSKSLWSKPLKFTTELESPLITFPAKGSINVPKDGTITWVLQNNIHRYHLQIATDENFEGVISELSNFDYEFYNYSLENNTKYFVRVKSFNDTNSSRWSDIVEFTTQNPSSVEESNDLFVNIFPNPSSDFITIRLSDIGLQPFARAEKVQLFDMLGLEVMSVWIGLDLSTQRIDVSHLPAGVYFIRIGNKVEKFVKM